MRMRMRMNFLSKHLVTLRPFCTSYVLEKLYKHTLLVLKNDSDDDDNNNNSSDSSQPPLFYLSKQPILINKNSIIFNQYQMKQLEYMIRMHKQNLSMILLSNNDTDTTDTNKNNKANEHGTIKGKEGEGGPVSFLFFFKFIHLFIIPSQRTKNKTKCKYNSLNRTLTGPDRTDLVALSRVRLRLRLRLRFVLCCICVCVCVCVCVVLLPSCQLYSFSLLQHKIYFVLFCFLPTYLSTCMPALSLTLPSFLLFLSLLFTYSFFILGKNIIIIIIITNYFTIMLSKRRKGKGKGR
jgi:hypothetical protein